MATLALNPIPTDADSSAPAQAVTQVAPAAGTSVLDIVQKAVAAPKPDMVLLTKLYLKLRNAKKDIDEQAKVKTRPLVDGMDRIESFFLEKMTEMGVDSLKNEAGTPYRSERVSVTVADVTTYWDYVLDKALEALPLKPDAKVVIKSAMVESGHLSLIEARASKTAVETYLEEIGELPPGLNRRVEATVNVRTS